MNWIRPKRRAMVSLIVLGALFLIIESVYSTRTFALLEDENPSNFVSTQDGENFLPLSQLEDKAGYEDDDDPAENNENDLTTSSYHNAITIAVLTMLDETGMHNFTGKEEILEFAEVLGVARLEDYYPAISQALIDQDGIMTLSDIKYVIKYVRMTLGIHLREDWIQEILFENDYTGLEPNFFLSHPEDCLEILEELASYEYHLEDYKNALSFARQTLEEEKGDGYMIDSREVLDYAHAMFGVGKLEDYLIDAFVEFYSAIPIKRLNSLIDEKKEMGVRIHGRDLVKYARRYKGVSLNVDLAHELLFLPFRENEDEQEEKDDEQQVKKGSKENDLEERDAFYATITAIFCFLSSLMTINFGASKMSASFLLLSLLITLVKAGGLVIWSALGIAICMCILSVLYEKRRTRQRQQIRHNSRQKSRQVVDQEQRRPRRTSRRRKGNRRSNRERQFQQTARVNVPVPATKSDAQDEASDSLSICSGQSLVYNQKAKNVEDNNDICPICHEHFGNELSETYCCVLPCQHACCLPCLRGWEKAKDNVVAKDCPVCSTTYRFSLEGVHVNLFEIVQERFNELEGVISLEEKIDIFGRLLQANAYQINSAVEAMEDMLVGSMMVPEPSNLEDLSTEEKAAIYVETQKPVLSVQKQLFEAREQLRKATTRQSYVQTKQIIDQLELEFIQAIQNARDDAYNQINNRGGMGILIDDDTSKNTTKTTTLQVDYHSLHRKAALRKFDELIVPILPVVGSINIITGKGKHNQLGVSVLQRSLKDHIDEHHMNSDWKCIGWEVLPTNAGILRVFHIS